MKQLTPFGKELRKLRIDHSMSLQLLGEKINISTAHLSAMERGDRNVVFGIFKRISKVFKLKESEKVKLMELANKSNNYKLYEMPF